MPLLDYFFDLLGYAVLVLLLLLVLPVHVAQLQQSISLEFTLTTSITLLTALQALHKEQLVHLDVKPMNLFVDSSGKVLLGDFRTMHTANTIIQMPVSTNGFVDPEAEKRAIATEAADIFSFGCTLTWLLEWIGMLGKSERG